MKVYIGPFPNYNKKTKKTPKRKIRVQVEGYDCWNANHTLALIILPVLKRLQKDKHGAPFTDDADVPEKIRSTNDKTKREDHHTDKHFFKRWDWILGEMIWAFEQEVDEDNEDQFHSGNIDLLWQGLDKDNKPIGTPEKWGKRKKGKEKEDAGVQFYSIVNGPKHTFKVDQKAQDKHNARKRNGLALFGKYYQTLWD